MRDFVSAHLICLRSVLYIRKLITAVRAKSESHTAVGHIGVPFPSSNSQDEANCARRLHGSR